MEVSHERCSVVPHARFIPNAGTTLEVRYEPGAATVRVPSIVEHEVVAVDFTV
jgi:hypothetical protein